MTQNFIYQIFIHNYDRYRESSVNTEKISHARLMNYISNLKSDRNFRISKEGASLEGRDIFSIAFGKGKIKILAWSQMHGDEPTASAALLDVLNFFAADDDNNDLRRKIMDEISFCFVPMLNPDGAEMMRRENAAGIDLNRDALRLQSPEARILMNKRNEFNPDFGFNLHDQNAYYTPGRVYRSSAISFLAPPFDYEKTTAPVRENSMKVIAEISSVLREIIPGHIAKYKDDHEPRSFGDNFMKNGTSAILIESGSWNNGGGKEFVRKLNFISMLTAFNSIARGEYKSRDAKEYEAIPQNEELLLDLILRNLRLKKNGLELLVDIGIKREKIYSSEGQSYFKSSIQEIGDLSTFYGIIERDMNGCYVVPGKISDDEIDSVNNITEDYLAELHSKGITHLRINNLRDDSDFTELHVNLIKDGRNKTNELVPDSNADFAVTDSEGKVKYIVINGFLIDISAGADKSVNGIISL